MDLLSRDQILGATDLKTEDVDVPEWGGIVRVRALTGVERDSFETGMVEIRGASRRMNLANIRARLVALTAVDAEGNRLFTDSDVAELGKKSGAALNRVWETARKLSALTDEDVDELAGDFESAPSGGSTSD